MAEDRAPSARAKLGSPARTAALAAIWPAAARRSMFNEVEARSTGAGAKAEAEAAKAATMAMESFILEVR